MKEEEEEETDILHHTGAVLQLSDFAASRVSRRRRALGPNNQSSHINQDYDETCISLPPNDPANKCTPDRPKSSQKQSLNTKWGLWGQVSSRIRWSGGSEACY